MEQIVIIGGGLAGSEAAWQIAKRDINVSLYEMRPTVETGAHVTADLGELVCSNSLGSNLPDRASGVLKTELRRMGSLLIECADQTAIPAGGALAVDRQAFSQLITKRIKENPKIEVIHQEITEIPIGPTIIASGPLTSTKLANSIAEVSGKEHLYFFDAISPIVSFESINMDIAFFGSRYNKGELKEGDYINCPLNQDQYDEFVNDIKSAERIVLHSFESAIESGVKAGADKFFEGCLPSAKGNPNRRRRAHLRPSSLQPGICQQLSAQKSPETSHRKSRQNRSKRPAQGAPEDGSRKVG